MDLIIINIITVLATISGRKRRQVYSQLPFCDKKKKKNNDEIVAPCRKTACENLTGKKQLPFCVICSYSWSCGVRKRGPGV